MFYAIPLKITKKRMLRLVSWCENIQYFLVWKQSMPEVEEKQMQRVITKRRLRMPDLFLLHKHIQITIDQVIRITMNSD